MAIRIESTGVYLEGKKIPLYSGSIHYWRHAPGVWRIILEHLRELGFEIVNIPIPWGLHEGGPGIFDFGEKNPQKGLWAFLDLCREIGLLAVVRPGPMIDEDMPFGGLPLRVIRNPAVWAMTSTGAPAVSGRHAPPSAVPSCASEKLFQEIEKYFDKLIPLLAPRQYPDGPVILCEMNRESAFQGRMLAYDLDYCPESVALYRRFLTDKFKTVGALNDAYGSKYADITEVVPPKNCDAVVQKDLLWNLDWVEYKEYLIRRFLVRLSQMIRSRGITVPLSVDGPAVFTTPSDALGLQQSLETPLVGMEVDPRPSEYAGLARNIRYLTGPSRRSYASRFRCGNSWLSPRVNSPADVEFAILCAVMHGMNAANFHILAEGDRWTGAPIRRSGEFREEYADVFRRLMAFFSKYRIWESKKNCRTLVLISKNLERHHSAFSTLNHAYLGLLRVPHAFSEVPSSLGFHTDPVRQSILEEGSWVRDACVYLEREQVEYNLADVHLMIDDMTKYDMLFVPTADGKDPKDQEKLLEFAGRGGHLVFGPALPAFDDRFHPASVFAEAIHEPGTVAYESGKITFLPSFDQARDLITPDMPNVILLNNSDLRLTIRGGSSILVFIANPTDKAQQSMVISNWPLKGVWNAPEAAQPGSATVELRPFSAQVWEVLK
jgi:beta-galactosidase